MSGTITLWTGRRWNFVSPDAREINAADWHALAFINRYGGAVGAYSVMEHLVRGTWLAESLDLAADVCRAYAVHDVPEVYPPHDLPGPVVAFLRRIFAETKERNPLLDMRDAVEVEVFRKCGVLDVFCDDRAALVHALDVAMLAAEKRDMLRGWSDVTLHEWSPKERIMPMSHDRVTSLYCGILERHFSPALAAEFWSAS